MKVILVIYRTKILPSFKHRDPINYTLKICKKLLKYILEFLDFMWKIKFHFYARRTSIKKKKQDLSKMACSELGMRKRYVRFDIFGQPNEYYIMSI